MLEDSHRGQSSLSLVGSPRPASPHGCCVTGLRRGPFCFLRVRRALTHSFSGSSQPPDSCLLICSLRQFPARAVSRVEHLLGRMEFQTCLFLFLFLFWSRLYYSFVYLSLSPLVYWHHESGGVGFLLYQCFLWALPRAEPGREGTFPIYKLPPFSLT